MRIAQLHPAVAGLFRADDTLKVNINRRWYVTEKFTLKFDAVGGTIAYNWFRAYVTLFSSHGSFCVLNAKRRWRK